MKRLIFGLLLIASQTEAKEIRVRMDGISFEPKIVTVHAGDSVVWQNVSLTDHTATGTTFDTGIVHSKEAARAIVFTKPGTYDYHCRIHGLMMSGTIKVAKS
jgi:plastocyanin